MTRRRAMPYPGAYTSLVVGCFLDLFECRMWIRRDSCRSYWSHPRRHRAAGRPDRGLHGSGRLDIGVPRRPGDYSPGICFSGGLQQSLPLVYRWFFPAYPLGHLHWRIIALSRMPDLWKFGTRTGLSSRPPCPGSARAAPQFRTAVGWSRFRAFSLFLPHRGNSTPPPTHVILSAAEGPELLPCK